MGGTVRIIALILLSVGLLSGQVANLRHAPGAPTNTACTDTLLYKNDTNGDMYNCQSGTLTLITTGGGFPLSGSGTTNRIAKFTAGMTLGNSSIEDDGATVTTTLPFSAVAFLQLRGGTSGALSLTVPAVAGSPSNLQLPVVDGTQGQVLGITSIGGGTAALGWQDSTVTVDADGGGCTNCVPGSDLTILGGVVGGNSGLNSASSPGAFVGNGTGNVKTVITPMSLGPLAMCLRTNPTNGASITLGVSKFINGATNGLTENTVTYLSGDTASCLQATLPGRVFFDRGEEIRFIQSIFGSSPPIVSGFAASVYGAAVQPLGVGLTGLIATGVTTYTNVGAVSEATTEGERGMVAPVDMTFRNLCVRTSTTQPGTGTLTITVRDTGAPTSLAVVIPVSGTAGTYCDTVNTAVYTQADWWSVELVNAAGTNSANVNYIGWEAVSLGSGASAILPFPVYDITVASTTEYSAMYAQDNLNATETNSLAPISRAGTIGNFFCYVETAAAADQIITVRVNQGASVLTATQTGGVPGVITGTGSAAIGATDSIGLEIAPGAGAQAIWGSCTMSLV